MKTNRLACLFVAIAKSDSRYRRANRHDAGRSGAPGANCAAPER